MALKNYIKALEDLTANPCLGSPCLLISCLVCCWLVLAPDSRICCQDRVNLYSSPYSCVWHNNYLMRLFSNRHRQAHLTCLNKYPRCTGSGNRAGGWQKRGYFYFIYILYINIYIWFITKPKSEDSEHVT